MALVAITCFNQHQHSGLSSNAAALPRTGIMTQRAYLSSAWRKKSGMAGSGVINHRARRWRKNYRVT